MSSLLRQLVSLLVVTIVAATLATSATKAAMALDCELALLGAGADSQAEMGSGPEADRVDQAALADTTDAHGEHDVKGGALDAGASHCDANAGPSSAVPALAAVVPFVDMGQALVVLHVDSLVELTVPEGLRRPPRA